MTHTEVQLALARMAQAASRRLSEQSLDAMAEIWHARLTGLPPVGAARAIESFIEDAKFPSIKEFRVRARDLNPRSAAPADRPDDARCPRGHLYSWRSYAAPGEKPTAPRRLCECEDRIQARSRRVLVSEHHTAVEDAAPVTRRVSAGPGHPRPGRGGVAHIGEVVS